MQDVKLPHMLSGLWSQIRGSLPYDLLKAAIRSTGLATMLTTAWFYFHNWLLQPASNATLLGIWAGSALLMTLAWVLNCRLMILEPRLEAISQFLNGTGYKRPGRDTALILPIKNQP